MNELWMDTLYTSNRRTALAGILGMAVGAAARAGDDNSVAGATAVDEVVIRPQEYPRALRNPHMGFTNRGFSESNFWATLVHCYIPWNAIEDHEGDDIEKINSWCNKEWQGVEARNVKVIPRVYLHWNDDQQHWPRDLQPYDYGSDQFLRRAVRLVQRLGACWNDDPRVAHVELGIFGKWGEHHSPEPTEKAQAVVGQAFAKAFPAKQVLVRHPWAEFRDQSFGLYWDSWAHADEMRSQAPGIRKLGSRYEAALVGGEVAYDWGRHRIHPGDNPTDTVSDVGHRDFLIDTIREFHCTQLRWVADYDESNSHAQHGADEIQRAFGYRFVLEELRYPRRMDIGRPFEVAFSLRNDGSAPCYYRWPVELSLLDSNTRQPVWKATFKEVDIRTWLPGDKWNSSRNAYEQPPRTYECCERFTLTEGAARGSYLLSLAILDPAGEVPSLRLASLNYLRGGRHPLGWCGVGESPRRTDVDPKLFDDPAMDDSLHYQFVRRP
jgi:hypothetical protein